MEKFIQVNEIVFEKDEDDQIIDFVKFKRWIRPESIISMFQDTIIIDKNIGKEIEVMALVVNMIYEVQYILISIEEFDNFISNLSYFS